MKRCAALGFAASLCGACAPELEDQPYLVERARLIAVLAEPPELRPGGEVVLTKVVASRSGGTDDFSYHFCSEAPPSADPRAVAEACLEETGIRFAVAGERARAAMPTDACSRFGPDPVGSDFRPLDADDTGGYYQPIVIDGLRQISVTLLRITCPLPDAPIDLARELQERYVANQNPSDLRLERENQGAWEPLASVRAGERTRLRLTWDDAAREQYWWLPPDASQLQQRREAFRVAWFVTAGTLDAARTGVGEATLEHDSGNVFTAPSVAGRVDLWSVVHDSRGGTAALHQVLDVR